MAEQLSDNLKRKACKKGEIIFREGDFEMFMYEIASGEVAIYAEYGKTGEKLLRKLSQWECFGEMGMISSMPRSATAVALTDAELVVIDGDHFDEFFLARPRAVYKIMEQMSDRVRALTGEYMEACQTIAEYLEAEEQHRPKDSSLLKKMAKFVGVYRKGR